MDILKLIARPSANLEAMDRPVALGRPDRIALGKPEEPPPTSNGQKVENNEKEDVRTRPKTPENMLDLFAKLAESASGPTATAFQAQLSDPSIRQSLKDIKFPPNLDSLLKALSLIGVQFPAGVNFNSNQPQAALAQLPPVAKQAMVQLLHQTAATPLPASQIIDLGRSNTPPIEPAPRPMPAEQAGSGTTLGRPVAVDPGVAPSGSGTVEVVGAVPGNNPGQKIDPSVTNGLNVTSIQLGAPDRVGNDVVFPVESSTVKTGFVPLPLGRPSHDSKTGPGGPLPWESDVENGGTVKTGFVPLPLGRPNGDVPIDNSGMKDLHGGPLPVEYGDSGDDTAAGIIAGKFKDHSNDLKLPPVYQGPPAVDGGEIVPEPGTGPDGTGTVKTGFVPLPLGRPNTYSQVGTGVVPPPVQNNGKDHSGGPLPWESGVVPPPMPGPGNGQVPPPGTNANGNGQVPPPVSGGDKDNLVGPMPWQGRDVSPPGDEDGTPPSGNVVPNRTGRPMPPISANGNMTIKVKGSDDGLEFPVQLGIPDKDTEEAVPVETGEVKPAVVHLGRTEPAPIIGNEPRALTKATFDSVAKQIIDRMESMVLGRKSGSVTIKLNPGDLGALTLTVKAFGQKIDTEIKTTNDDVRAALQTHRSDLVSSIESRGLSLNSFTVGQEAPQQNQQGNGQQSGQAEADRNARLHAGMSNAPTSNAAPQAAAYRAASTGMDMVA